MFPQRALLSHPWPPDAHSLSSERKKKKKKKAAPKLSSFPFTKPLGIILLEGITAGIKTRAHKEADPVLTGGRQR